MIPLVDTGPLVALLDRSDRHHAWAVEVFSQLRGPLMTCEAVVAEVLFLCARNRVSAKAVWALLESRTLRPLPVFAESPEAVVRLLKRYASVPMSLADGCVLRLHETLESSVVLTCDSDFRVYRRSRGRAVDMLAPDGI